MKLLYYYLYKGLLLLTRKFVLRKQSPQPEILRIYTNSLATNFGRGAVCKLGEACKVACSGDTRTTGKSLSPQQLSQKRSSLDDRGVSCLSQAQLYKGLLLHKIWKKKPLRDFCTDFQWKVRFKKSAFSKTQTNETMLGFRENDKVDLKIRKLSMIWNSSCVLTMKMCKWWREVSPTEGK